MTAPPSKPRSFSFWRVARRVVRWLRITALLLVLAALGAALYLNLVGLPGFLKRPLLDELAARGLRLQCARLHWHFTRGVVAEGAEFGAAGVPEGARATARSVDLNSDWRGVWEGRPGAHSLLVRGGLLVWPLGDTNTPRREVVLEDVEAALTLTADDCLEVNRFQARYGGGRLRLGGAITNVSALRQSLFAARPSPPADPARPAPDLQATLRAVVDTLDAIQFLAPPDLNLTLRGDGRNLAGLSGLLVIRAPGALTPHADITNATLTARLAPAPLTGRFPFGRVDVNADVVATRWATISNAQLTLNFATHAGGTNLLAASLEVRARQAATEWVQAGATTASARWVQSLTNPIPLQLEGTARLAEARGPWAAADVADLKLWLAPAAVDHAPPDDSWAAWARIEPFRVGFQIACAGLEARGVKVASARCGGSWSAPDLILTNLQARLAGGRLDGEVSLNVATRAARFRAAADFDVKGVFPWLTESARKWVSQFDYERPPEFTGAGALTLPPWTETPTNWWFAVRPTFWLDAAFDSGPGAYRGMQVTSARSRLRYADEELQLPDLAITRPEGGGQLAHRASDRARDFAWRLDVRVDPKAVLPVLGEGAERALELFEFQAPASFKGELWGLRRERTPRSIRGELWLTNFTFRGEAATAFHTRVDFTNNVLLATGAELLRPEGVATVEVARVDIEAEKVFLTNAFSTVDPLAIARAISPQSAHAITPYVFTTPPTARVTGTVPFHGSAGTDLRFELAGGPFRWSRFHLTNLTGAVHYTGDAVTLEGISGGAYGGQLAGDAAFDLGAAGTPFRFNLSATQIELDQLMAGISDRDSRLEGTFDTRLIVRDARVEDWESWQGVGDVRLTNGFLWELPIFGVLSPVFDGMVPGLGKSRFNRGTADFIITNSVIYFANLELRAPLLRLKSHGSVDFHERINARVESDVLPTMGPLASVLNAVLWPVTKALEYKVTGTLDAPQAQPVHVPKVLLFPLQPFQTLKDIFQDKPAPATNAPAGPPPGAGGPR